MTHAAGAGVVLHLSVEICDAQQAAVVVVALEESLEVRSPVGHPLYLEDDAQALSRQCDVHQEPVGIVLEELYQAFGLPFCQSVDVHQRVLRIGHDVLLPAVAIEEHGRRKGRTPAPLDFVGIGIEALLLEVSELLGISFRVASVVMRRYTSAKVMVPEGLLVVSARNRENCVSCFMRKKFN